MLSTSDSILWYNYLMTNCTESYVHTTLLCKYCQEPFPKRVGKPNAKDKQLFCNTSCAAKYNNRVRFPNSASSLACAHCLVNPKERRSRYCTTCRDTKAYRFTGRRTAEDVTLQVLKDKYGLSQYHAKIRGYARTVYYRTQRPKSCAICDYAKHVDICHIKDLKDFTLESKLSEVNHPENLVALCKNHHWEFDNHMLSEPDSEILRLFSNLVE